MNHRWSIRMGISGAAAALALMLSLPSTAQVSGSDSEPAPPTPRLPDGTVNLGGAGIWNLPYITNMATPVRGGEEIEIPFQPWAKALFDYHVGTSVKYDPEGFCLPPGGPRAFATPYPAQFIQQSDPERIIVIFEGGAHVWREIFMDGRSHPEGDALNPTYFGHSVGHWEGDTLVVDTVGFNEKTWIDFAGHPHTGQLHTIERFTRSDLLTLHYEATFDDPGAYTRPWTTGWDISFTPGGELQEYICQENNKYLLDLKDDFGLPFFGTTDDSN
jgi:hypothetical protein